MNNYTIDAETMKTVVAKAIFDNISANDRENLIVEALSYLTTPAKDRYGDLIADSPLQAAFNDAIRKSAIDVVKELLSQPEHATRIDLAIRDAVAKSLANSAGLSSAIGYAVSEVIENRIKEWG